MSKSLSIWLKGSGNQDVYLGQQVERASSVAGTAPFPSHITLTSVEVSDGSGVPAVLQQVEKLCTEVCVFSVTFSYLSMHPTAKYRCVFVNVEHDAPVMELNERAVQQIGRKRAEPYLPHLSLVYDQQNNISPSQREIIIQQLTPTLLHHYVLEVTSLEVWDTTDADYTQWQCVGSFELSVQRPEKRARHIEHGSSGDESVHYPFIRLANQLAQQAVQKGNHPFGACLVINNEVVLTAENSVLEEPADVIRHAELNLVSKAYRTLSREALSQSRLYTSCEPCPMCTGSIYWAGIPSIVYCTSEESLLRIAGDSLGGCRSVLAQGVRSVEVIGPILEEEGIPLHEAYWKH